MTESSRFNARSLWSVLSTVCEHVTSLRSQPVDVVSHGRSKVDDPEATAHFPPPPTPPPSSPPALSSLALESTQREVGDTHRSTGGRLTGLDYPVPAGFVSLGVISQSSHGAVYKVTRPPSREVFALKVIHCPDPRVAANLVSALKLMAGIKHAGFVDVRDVMQLPQLVVCVMEWIGKAQSPEENARTGADLIAMLRDSERPAGHGQSRVNIHGLASDRLWPALGLDARAISPSLVRAARPPTPFMSLIAAQFAGLARALDQCHQMGIVHGDIKPANIFLRSSGELALGDFGSLTITGSTGVEPRDWVSGTPKYLAPERVPSMEIGATPSTLNAPDPRTEVWSLGVCLFEFLTLTSAFEATTSAEMYRAIATLDVPSARSRQWMVPQELEDVCRVSTSRDTQQRYGSAGEMADALEAFAYARTQVGANQARLRRPSVWASFMTGWMRNQLSHMGLIKGVRQ